MSEKNKKFGDKKVDKRSFYKKKYCLRWKS